MYEPLDNDDEHRLRRKEPDEGAMSIGWVFMPAVLGMLSSVFLMLVLPVMIKAIGSQQKINKMGSDITKVLNEQFRLLLNMKWDQTNLWIYLIAGALIGILVRVSFSDDKA